MPGNDVYHRLIGLLEDRGAAYRLIDHAPEGRTDRASRLRGNSLRQAAKCMVVEVRVRKGVARYLLAVVPGVLRIDLETARQLIGGRRAALASPATAERLTGCAVGAIVPFSFAGDGLALVADPWLLEERELYFNAARLDRSLVLRTADYLELARPHLEPVAVPAPDEPEVGEPDG